MAILPDTRHNNKHVMVCGCTGSGKSQAAAQLGLPPGKGDRVLLWDIDEDHKGLHFEDRARYARALAMALRSGKGFRLAWAGSDTPATFEWWCNLVWACLRGDKITYVLIEELADVSPSTAKATPQFGRLLRKGRKYGAVIIMAAQRGAEVSKTCWTQVAKKIIGQQQAEDLTKMAKLAGVPVEAIQSLKPLEFFVKPSGVEPAQLTRLRYRNLKK